MSLDKPIKETTGYALAHAGRHHRQRAGELLNEIGLHVGQEMMMLVLWECDGVTQTELAEALMIQPATVTVSLRHLERAGFVERKIDLEDQRISRVFVTEKGCELKEAVHEKWSQLEEETFYGLSIEECLLLRRLLMQINQNLVRCL